MGAQTPKAAGSDVSFRPADHQFHSLTTGSDAESRGVVAPAWHGAAINADEAQYDETRPGSPGSPAFNQASSTSDAGGPSIPDQLADLLMDLIPGQEGRNLSEAFQYAADVPPITRQSLSELDIPSIITNIKLRHDVNFDRDLTFRPNFDGAKGEEKRRMGSRYWQALVAELELYVRLFQGSPSLWHLTQVSPSEIAQHAKRRIPRMFETIQEILKCLVPDRDHARVDEHLDVPMLMQKIERGVCDLVRLAEWMANLLKEHCAPIRDAWVDEMVQMTRDGVVKNSSYCIVSGLCKLLGILETMKLDVANHQIRNLQSLLVEDTVNFQKQYHLERLLNGKARVNLDVAQKWFDLAVQEFRHECTSPPRDVARFQTEVLGRAVVSMLFRDEHCNFPEPFYLDLDRLRALKSEMDDFIFFEISFDLFLHLLKKLGYQGAVSGATRQHLKQSLSAIISEGLGHGVQQWRMNSEHISLELIRQALALTGRSPNYRSDDLQRTNDHLRAMYSASYPAHAARLETTILPQALSTISRYINSSPIELFNAFVPQPSPASVSAPLQAPDTFNPEAIRMTEMSNRLAHILILHWRIWGPIVYMQADRANGEGTVSSNTTPFQTNETRSTVAAQTEKSQRQQHGQDEPEAQAVGAIKAGEPPDEGQATRHAPGASSS